MTSRRTVAVIGGGVGGVLTAVNLARSGCSARVVLVERTARIARGAAYSTRSNAHLLNVPAARMSAFAHDPEHFLRWARGRLGAATAGDAFLPRRLFGEYVAELLGEACASGRNCIERVHGAAIDIMPGARASIALAGGMATEVDRVVLALGNARPRQPPVREGAEFYATARYVPDPWADGAFDAVGCNDDVLLLGTGLTMYDVVLALRERGHVAGIHAVSRRGQRPRSHAPSPLQTRPAPPSESWLRIEPTARALLRAVRGACEGTAGANWRGIVDSIRPVSPAIWARLTDRERRRFLTWLKPFWEAHRHRAAVEVYRQIDHLVASGSLVVRRGRVRAWQQVDAGVRAILDEGTIRVAHVINCTGPDTDVRCSQDPLVRSLLARGLIVRDAQGLGVETNHEGAVIAADGHASSWLFTLGSWCKPRLWESTAVPELREQAAALGRRLAASFPTDRPVSAAPVMLASTG